YEKYVNLTPEETNEKILEIIEIIEHDQIESVQKAKLFFELGYLQNIKQDYQAAISSFDKALEFKPDKHEVWYNKACSYALQGNINQAIANLQTAINLDPETVKDWVKTDSDFDAIWE
ncbi:MAG: TPR end-of-group domain-containing protein, partial [bacterium]